MIKVETYTVANLGRARIGERFEFKGQTYEVLDIEVYENAGGQERMAVTLQTYCHVCGASFEFTVNRRPKWLKKSCGRDHAPKPVHTKPTRQNATSSQGEAIQAEAPEVKRYSPPTHRSTPASPISPKIKP
ncbi:MAG TPA: hypothetical protein PLT37_04925 [Kiritimatiellia bacterium]|nr:hypothetical protein [Kiritimatiellia bacterium]HQG74639.1 hypothetical protein [Kiritimatiellia bacterium]